MMEQTARMNHAQHRTAVFPDRISGSQHMRDRTRRFGRGRGGRFREVSGLEAEGG